MKLECPWIYQDCDTRWRCAAAYDADDAAETLGAHLVYVHGVTPDFAARVAHRLWTANKDGKE